MKGDQPQPNNPPEPDQRVKLGKPGQPDRSTADAEDTGQHSLSIPSASVARLSLYLRELRRMVRDSVHRVSSNELGRRLGVSAAIVRRDLANLGHLGRRGVGYDPNSLAARIRSALGADKAWNVVLVGTGSLGTALLRYRGFSEQGFRLVAAFDIRPDRIGESLGGVPVLDLAELEEAIVRLGVSLAILAVPAEAAQDVAIRLSQAGVTGILNFAPVTLRIGGDTCIANVDLASELQQLSFAVARLAVREDEENFPGS